MRWTPSSAFPDSRFNLFPTHASVFSTHPIALPHLMFTRLFFLNHSLFRACASTYVASAPAAIGSKSLHERCLTQASLFGQHRFENRTRDFHRTACRAQVRYVGSTTSDAYDNNVRHQVVACVLCQDGAPCPRSVRQWRSIGTWTRRFHEHRDGRFARFRGYAFRCEASQTLTSNGLVHIPCSIFLNWLSLKMLEHEHKTISIFEQHPSLDKRTCCTLSAQAMDLTCKLMPLRLIFGGCVWVWTSFLRQNSKELCGVYSL